MEAERNINPENTPAQKKLEDTESPKKRSKVFLIILIVMIVGGSIFGFTKYQHSLRHETTDDAQVEADIFPVIARVSGYVKEVRVTDNQIVKKGDTLIVIDDRDLKMKLMEAEAALATAQSNVRVSKANTNAARSGIASSRAGVSTIDAQIDAAQINVTRTSQDYNRFANLIKDHSITQQQYEQAQAAMELAQKQLQILQQQKAQASTQTNVVASQSNATAASIAVAESMVKQREVDVANAKLNLSYTVVTAPEDGKVSKVNTQTGQLLQAGQSTFNIVHTNNIWVVANFKETQFRKMAIGQKVSIKVDAFPSHEFEATITSFSPATGAKFSILPPDNASGNFVKVVQRLPVKIEFSDKNDSLLQRLTPGMNVDADVHLN